MKSALICTLRDRWFIIPTIFNRITFTDRINAVVSQINPNITAGIMGLIFLINGAVVTVMSPLAGWICDKTVCRVFIRSSPQPAGFRAQLETGPRPV